jgi:pyridoxal phosphate enzyme (YggS family)
VIAERIAAVRERLSRAAARAGRHADEITLVAVGKTHPADTIAAAFEAGLHDFGENKVQEAAAKIESLAALRARGLRWHLIGHLQSNKARRAVEIFDRIDSVDSGDLGARLDRMAGEAGRVLPVLVQVELGGEATKSGLTDAALMPALESLRALPHLRVEGLMTIPAAADDPQAVRPFFRRLRELRDRAQVQGLLQGDTLSMGMSDDYEVAIEEGSTMVRIGSALFGERRLGPV